MMVKTDKNKEEILAGISGGRRLRTEQKEFTIKVITYALFTQTKSGKKE